MRKKQNSFSDSLIYILLTAIFVAFLSAPAASTGIDWDYNEGDYIVPGESGVRIADFEVLDGGDILIRNSTEPGESLVSFEDNETMFVNQSNGQNSGLAGFGRNDSVLRVKRENTGGWNETLNGFTVRGFSNETVFADGGVSKDGEFNGDEGVLGNNETIIRDNGTVEERLDKSDYVLSEGAMDLRRFEDDTTYIDGAEGNSEFDGGNEPIIRHSGVGDRLTLEDSDTVLRNGSARIKEFNDGNIAFTDTGYDDVFESGNAIIRDIGEKNNILEEEDILIKEGSAALEDAGNTNLSYYESVESSTSSFDRIGEPIYYEGVQDGFVNASSSIRIGNVSVTSRNDSVKGNVDLDLETLAYIYGNVSNTSDNDVGRKLQNVTRDKTGYDGTGSFLVLEYDVTGPANKTWSPYTGGDQDVLIYDFDGTDNLSTGDVLIYDTNPANDNITVGVGEKFNSTEVKSSSAPNEVYTPDFEVGFEDNGDGTFSPSDDNVSVNVSYGDNWSLVRLAPAGITPSIRSSANNFVSGGAVRFWNSDGKGDVGMSDGLYVDVNVTGNVSSGDVRLGHWEVLERPGAVLENDLDVGVGIEPLESSDDLKYFDSNESDAGYQPGTSGKAVDTNGRDAIISSANLDFDNSDVLVKSGFAAMGDFKADSRFIDNDLSGKYDQGEAIVRNHGNDPEVLEEEDEVVLPGEAGLDPFSNSIWYVETGKEPDYEKRSNESIIYDGDEDGVIERGDLSSGEHRVIVPGKANLEHFSDPPEAEGSSGLVYVDKNGTGQFNGDEDILEVELLLNASEKGLTGQEIHNFANTTRHDGSGLYSRGDAIVNDSDNNSVYKDIFRSLELENIYTKSNAYEENLSSEEVEGGIELYRNPGSGDDTKVATLTSGAGESYTWSASGFSEDITNDTDFYIEFDAEKEVGEKVYGVRLETTEVMSESGLLENLSCSNIVCDTRIIDAHPPEFKSAMTGASWGGNRSERDKILLRVIEVGSGLNGGSFDFTDFSLSTSEINVTKAEKTGLWGNGAEIRLTLNDSLETDATPDVNLSGTMLDFAQNTRQEGETEAMDGLRPLLMDVSYEDRDVDGRVDELDFEFSENVNLTSFDASGWVFDEAGIPCIQVLTPGENSSFCSTVSEDLVDVTSDNDSGLYVNGLNLSTMKAVNSSKEGVKEYEVGAELYDVSNSTTGYGGNGSFDVYEYNTSDNDSDGVWNPNQSSGDQDVLVYDVDDEDLSEGDVVIYKERPGNGNIPVESGKQLNATQAADASEPYRSYELEFETGYLDEGDGSYEPFTDNASLRVSYNSSSFESPNSSLIALTPPEQVPEVYSGSFVEKGDIGFRNTSGSGSSPLQDGLYLDMDSSGNVTHGDVRLVDWTLKDAEDLYTHRLTTTAGSQLAGDRLNGTEVRFETRKIGWTGVENLRKAYIERDGSRIQLEDNVTDLTSVDSGEAVNISFDTTQDSELQESDELVIRYYTSYEAGIENLERIDVNPTDPGGVFDGTSSMEKGNSSELEFDATALENITGVENESLEPSFSFDVLGNVLVDGSGNTLTNTSSVSVEDEAAPAITEVHTSDADKDARTDRLKLWFSEGLDDLNSSYSSAFNLSNGTIESVWNREANSSRLTLNVSSVGGTAFTPNVTLLNDTVLGEHHNSAHELQNYTSVKDRASPVLLNAEIDPVNSSYYYSFVDFKLSENVSGRETVLESAGIDGKTVEFNRTDSSDDYTVNYSEVLGTGDVPNITSVSGLHDDSGNGLVLQNGKKVAVNTFRREIVEGWNFVSFPIADQSTPEIEEVMDTSRVEVIWMKRNGTWSSHDPDAPETVNDFGEVKGGRGYLVKATDNFTMSVNVNSDWSGGGLGVGQANASLRPGEYNLVGQFQEYRQDADYEAAFRALTQGDIGRVYQQDSEGSLDLERIKTGNPGTSNHMNPGQAYWVRIQSSSIDSWTWGIPKR